MKIVLVYAGIARIGWNSFNKRGMEDDDSFTIPQGLCYLKAVLQQQTSHVVEMLDCRQLTGPEDLRYRIKSSDCDIVGISFLSPSRNYGILVAKIAKELGKITLAGGIHASALPHDLLKTGCFDYIFFGEGEWNIIDFIRKIENKEDIPRIYKGNNYVQNLDELPFPATAFLPTYTKSSFEINGRMAGITGSRGCPGKCKYCFPSQEIIYGTRRIRIRSAENIIKEMLYLKNNFDIEFIAFYDDTFTWNKKFLKNFYYYIKNNKIKIPSFAVNARADCFDEERALLLKNAGCVGIWFGFESGSPRILQIINKNTNVEDAIRASEICHELGLDVNVNILVGIPGETKDDYILTYKFLKKIKPLNVRYNILSPFPGSYFYEQLSKNNMIKHVDFEMYEMNANFEGPGIIEGVDYDLVREWAEPFREFQEKGRLQKEVDRLRIFEDNVKRTIAYKFYHKAKRWFTRVCQ